MVSIPACHAGDRGSIPRRGVLFFIRSKVYFLPYLTTSDLLMDLKWNSSIEFSKEHYNESNYVPVIQIRIVFSVFYHFQRIAPVKNLDSIIVSYWPKHLVLIQ